ncbi:unnamed protein product, partial [Prorocentrum cordatum]
GKRSGCKGAATDTSVAQLLSQAVQATEDAALQAALKQQIEKISSQALRKAGGAWTSAEHHCGQCVDNVLRLRRSLRAAEARESRAAEALAAAAAAKKAAAHAAAQAEGVALAAQASDLPAATFKVEWDGSFCSSPGDVECAVEGRQALGALRAQLVGVKDDLAGRGCEIKAWLAKAAAEGQAPPAPAEAASPPGAEAERQAKVKTEEEAKRLSEARFTAEKEAAARSKSKGKDSDQ